jgi:hypothetical protein
MSRPREGEAGGAHKDVGMARSPECPRVFVPNPPNSRGALSIRDKDESPFDTKGMALA